MPAAYPILLDLADRSVVIVGGGEVATRKMSGVIECGAVRVTMVAPVIQDVCHPLVVKIVEAYHSRHLDGAGLVFAATDAREVNDAVVRDAKLRKIPVNRADEGGELGGDFTVPARFTDGPATVAVSAGSAALSASIRDELSRHWKPGWTELAKIMVILRPIIRDGGLGPDVRRGIFRTLATPAAVGAAAKGRQSLMDLLRREHPELEGLPI